MSRVMSGAAVLENLYLVPVRYLYEPCEKVSSNMRKMHGLIHLMHAWSYRGLCSPFIHSVVPMILLVDSEGPDQA